MRNLDKPKVLIILELNRTTMNNLSIQKAANLASLFCLLLVLFSCAVNFFGKNAEWGTLVYFYLFFSGVISLFLLSIILFQYLADRENRKKIRVAAVRVIMSYAILLLVCWFILS
jgi:NADH:ubiquinone oxidoreductase subunit 6 (subunit J)